jgi:hypothetical protein
MPTFKTTLIKADDVNATGITIPPEVIAELGAGKKPRVKVTLNGSYSYSYTVAVMGGEYMIGLNQERREASGITPVRKSKLLSNSTPRRRSSTFPTISPQRSLKNPVRVPPSMLPLPRRARNLSAR